MNIKVERNPKWRPTRAQHFSSFFKNTRPAFPQSLSRGGTEQSREKYIKRRVFKKLYWTDCFFLLKYKLLNSPFLNKVKRIAMWFFKRNSFLCSVAIIRRTIVRLFLKDSKVIDTLVGGFFVVFSDSVWCREGRRTRGPNWKKGFITSPFYVQVICDVFMY